MNTPAHIAAAGLVSQSVLWLDQRHAAQLPAWFRPTACVVGCVTLGVASHLVLDLLPHYNWIVYLKWFSGLPYHWLIREALLGAAVLAVILVVGRKRWGLVCVTTLAAMYPDLEKVARVDHGLPVGAVVFRGHSLELSNNDGGLPHGLLVGGEVGLILLMLVGAVLIARNAEVKR